MTQQRVDCGGFSQATLEFYIFIYIYIYCICRFTDDLEIIDLSVFNPMMVWWTVWDLTSFGHQTSDQSGDGGQVVSVLRARPDHLNLGSSDSQQPWKNQQFIYLLYCLWRREEWVWGQNPICNMGEKSILSGDSRSSILLHRHRHGPYCCPHLIITNGLMFSCVTSMITVLTSAEPTALTEGEIWAVKLRTEDDGRTDGGGDVVRIWRDNVAEQHGDEAVV